MSSSRIGVSNKITTNSEMEDQQDFSVQLNQHQLAVIRRMKIHELQNFKTNIDDEEITINASFGILKTRLKTLTVLGLINSTKGIKIPYNKRTQNETVSKVDKPPNGEILPTNLVVFSYYTQKHWEDEISKTKLKSLFIDCGCMLDEITVSDYDIILINDRNFKKIDFDTMVFNRVIVDNVDVMPLKYTKYGKAIFTWYLTNNVKKFHNITRISEVACTSMQNLKLLTVKCRSEMYTDLNTINLVNIECKRDGMRRFTRNDAHNVRQATSVNDAIRMLDVDYLTPEEAIDGINHNVFSESRRLELSREISSSKICGICLESTDSSVFVRCCYNIFCKDCFISANTRLEGNGRCSYCRDPMTVSAFCVTNDRVLLRRASSKIDTTIKYIEDHPEDTHLILCENNEKNMQLQSRLPKTKVLKGKYSGMVSSIEKIKSGQLANIVMTSREHFLQGLPLHNINSVIIITDFHACSVKNITRRIYNMDKNVNVINMTSPCERNLDMSLFD
jgi:hypothetical protein